MQSTSSPTSPPVREDKSKEPNWVREGRRGLFGAHWSFTFGLVAILILAIVITCLDAWVGLSRGLNLLDITLQAEAEVTVAIIALIGGSYAVLRFLTPPAKEP